MLASRIERLPMGRQVLLGALASARFVPLAVDNELTGGLSLPPAMVAGMLALHQDPVGFARAPAPAGMGRAIFDWLGQFEDEPESREYWPYQAAVIVELMMRSRSIDVPTEPVLSMLEYCADFAYFMDESLDDSTCEDAEKAYWADVVSRLERERLTDEALADVGRATSEDSLRILEIARSVARLDDERAGQA